MDPTIWAKAHGATTHFPFALVLCSAALDGAGFVAGQRPIARELRTAGYWTIMLAALGSVGAVFSGVFMTNGNIVGHGALRMHHMFVWPAFALMIALAVWRFLAGQNMSRRLYAGYLAGSFTAAGLVSAAAYWGGELILRS